MADNDPLILYIVVREALQLSPTKATFCVANAVEYILLKYFTIQVVSIKLNMKKDGNYHIQDTTKWLASHSPKAVVVANEDAWTQLKKELPSKNCYLIKDSMVADDDTETTLVFWPRQYSLIPETIKNLHTI